MNTAILTPLGFWNSYKAEIIRRKPDLIKYSNKDGAWTELTRDAAISTMLSGALRWSTEYFRIDVIGFESHGSKWDWSLRIAFEHENEYRYNQWKDELCKLTHMVADLRVLAGYYDSSEQDCKFELQSQVNQLLTRSDRITRDPEAKWLFIFGPADGTRKNGSPFVLYTLEGEKVVQLPDSDPLVPESWARKMNG